MPRRSFIAVAVLAVAYAATAANDAVAVFAPGEFFAYSQDSWGANPSPVNAAGLLIPDYYNVYASTSGVVEVGIHGPTGFSLLFTNPIDINAYLPALGSLGPLTSDYINPSTTTAGAFGGQLVALQLNIDFSDAGVMLGSRGLPFGELVIHDVDDCPLVNDLSVRQFLHEASNVLGGGSMPFKTFPSSLESLSK